MDQIRDIRINIWASLFCIVGKHDAQNHILLAQTLKNTRKSIITLALA